MYQCEAGTRPIRLRELAHLLPLSGLLHHSVRVDSGSGAPAVNRDGYLSKHHVVQTFTLVNG